MVDAPKNLGTLRNGGDKRRAPSEHKQAGPHQPEKQPFVFEGSPFDKDKEPDLYKAHEVALKILHDARPEIPEVHIPDKASVDTKERLEKERARNEYARARNEQLTEAFAYQRAQKKPEDQQAEARGQGLSEILEAMVLIGSKKMFGERAAVLPTEYSDRVDGADVVVTLKKGVAFVIDAATDQDIDGYAPPVWAPAGTPKDKGLNEKLKKSYTSLANVRGRMSGVQYVDIGDGKVGEKANMPRVIVALSQETIRALSVEWAKNPEAFDYVGNTYTKQIQYSVASQLVAQLRFARDEQKREKKYTDKEGNEKTPNHHEEKHLRAVLRTLHEKVPIQTDGAAPEALTDPLLKRIHETVTSGVKRQKILVDARREQAEYDEKSKGGFSSTEREIGDGTLSLHERKKLEDHVERIVPPEKRSEVYQALYDFLHDPRKVIPAAIVAMLAGGISYKIYERIKEAREGKKEPDTPAVGELPKVTAPATSAGATLPASPTPAASAGQHAVLPGATISAPRLATGEHHAQLPAASVGAHLAAVDALRASLKGNMFEKRSARLWSRIQNFALHKLTSSFGVLTGSMAKWVLCGLGLGTFGAVAGGLLVGGAAAFGAWQYLKKKGWHDDPWARERAGATQAVLRDIHTYPATYGYLLTNEAARTKEIERRTKQRVRLGQATLAITNAAIAGTALQLRTGGEFLPALGRDVQQGTLSNTLALFACKDGGWLTPSGAGAHDVVPTPLGTGPAAIVPPSVEVPAHQPSFKNPWVPAPDIPWNSWAARAHEMQIPEASYDCHMQACENQLRLDNIQTRPDATGEWRITDQADRYAGRWRKEDMGWGSEPIRSYTWNLGSRAEE